MKKTYLQPTMNIVFMEVNQIVATSNLTITVSEEETNVEGRAKENSWSSIWDDDWSAQ